jgi:hypothetical protein
MNKWPDHHHHHHIIIIIINSGILIEFILPAGI